jgi:hypothetical protein
MNGLFSISRGGKQSRMETPKLEHVSSRLLHVGVGVGLKTTLKNKFTKASTTYQN